MAVNVGEPGAGLVDGEAMPLHHPVRPDGGRRHAHHDRRDHAPGILPRSGVFRIDIRRRHRARPRPPAALRPCCAALRSLRLPRRARGARAARTPRPATRPPRARRRRAHRPPPSTRRRMRGPPCPRAPRRSDAPTRGDPGRPRGSPSATATWRTNCPRPGRWRGFSERVTTSCTSNRGRSRRIFPRSWPRSTGRWGTRPPSRPGTCRDWPVRR